MAQQIQNLGEIPQEEPTQNKIYKYLPVLSFVLVIGLGVLTGYLLSSKKSFSGLTGLGKKSSTEEFTKGEEFGAKDVGTFKDTAMGIVEAGGINGEGTHKLLREGGPSQTVFLMSSVLDLDKFVGKEIQVWGETFKAQKAGWLMDVGKVKILSNAR